MLGKNRSVKENILEFSEKNLAFKNKGYSKREEK